MEKHPNNLFPLEIWVLVIVIVAPLLLVIVGCIDQKLNVGIEFLVLFILFGAFFSLPALLISFLSFKFLVARTKSSFLVKVLFNLVVILTVITYFWIMSGSMAFMLSLIYSASVVLSTMMIPVFGNRSKTISQLPQ
ncbi:hypothetical protein ACFSC6_03130 [Rufibacter sediminis]|uniref:Uncharacterized protein n=1 Tax=Rufibacter sediminis TaxID=2762756 RepID=A0ABR6VWD5_9BACT|nr:hypothetical protein [Rufibacter sediminis]MBC3541148.1 hypothetical protein [Rufibacter sediminis]